MKGASAGGLRDFMRRRRKYFQVGRKNVCVTAEAVPRLRLKRAVLDTLRDLLAAVRTLRKVFPATGGCGCKPCI